MSTVDACHESPWSPLRLHTASPAALVTRSSPMSAPYMWWWKMTVLTPIPMSEHAEPLYARLKRSPGTLGLDASA